VVPRLLQSPSLDVRVSFTQVEKGFEKRPGGEETFALVEELPHLGGKTGCLFGMRRGGVRKNSLWGSSSGEGGKKCCLRSEGLSAPFKGKGGTTRVRLQAEEGGTS